MRAALLWAFACAASAPAQAQPALGGGTGLLEVPSAEVLAEGTADVQYSRIYPDLARTLQAESYYAGMGFAPGLELGGRAITPALRVGRRDLSLDAKYRLPWELAGVSFAIGAQDLGGVERLLPREYAVATWRLGTLSTTVGYGRGRNVLDGAFGGLQWRPWRFVTLVAEHDAEDVNGGVKLFAPEVRGWRLGVTAAYRGALRTEEYAVHLGFALGARRGEHRAAAEGSSRAPPHGNADLRAALQHLGFESIRIGRRDDTLVVRLENRRYNHAAADGLGLALGAIAARAADDVARVELYLYAYGAPQFVVDVPAALYRAWLADPQRHHAALREALRARPVDGIAGGDAVAWDNELQGLQALELVLEPVLRTFVATEFGLLDAALGARARLTAPLGRGVLVHLGLQAPLASSGDFDEGRTFASTEPEAGLDLALAQYLHTPAPGWTLLWSAGRAQVFRVDADTLGLDTAWSPGDGRHRFRAKLMAMHSDAGARELALAGYNWLDAKRAWGIGLTGGRFYAGDAGGRIDLERYFGDTIVGLSWRFASPDDQAVAVALSLPLTPRRDARPRGLQVKGPRRWTHSLGSTLNAPPNATSPAGTNPIRPLLLYEPMLDLDLERDLHDAGRLNERSLREALPRMHEAWGLWGS